MRKTGSSKTAELAAMIRALAAHSSIASGIMSDPYAKYFLSPLLKTPYFINRIMMEINPWFWQRGINSVGFLIALCRHRFMNDLVLSSLEQGNRQVVLLGAGYDTMIFRNSESFGGTRIFEVDHPNTQLRKLKIIKRHSITSQGNVVYLPIDLRNERIPELLYEKGLNENEAVLVIAEGILSYLSEESIGTLFHDMANLTAKVRFAADYRFPQINARNVGFTLLRWRNEFKIMKEKYQTVFSVKEMEDYLINHKYRISVNRNLIDLWKDYSQLKPPEYLWNIAGLFVAEGGIS